MPRTKRSDEAGQIYHALNRGNHQQDIFHKPEDFHAFLRALSEGLNDFVGVRLGFRFSPDLQRLRAFSQCFLFG